MCSFEKKLTFKVLLVLVIALLIRESLISLDSGKGLDSLVLKPQDKFHLKNGNIAKCTKDKGKMDFKARNGRKKPAVHQESMIAHKYLDGLCGLELGAASYAPFGLKTATVGLTPELDERDAKFIDEHQIKVNGVAVKIDIPGYAHNLSLLDDSCSDFLVASHVLEHLPDPIGSIIEWGRVVRPGGYLFLMVPHRRALPSDAARNITSMVSLVEIYKHGATPESRSKEEGIGYREHYNVFDQRLLTQIGDFVSDQMKGKRLLLTHFQEVDDVLQLGHTIVWRVHQSSLI